MLPHDDLGSGPVVVLLHAGVADRTMWSEHLAALAEAGYRALAVDLPGFGDAAIAPGEQAPWTDVLETMDALAIDRATLVGNSFGGAVALRAAHVAPERVSALVLVSAPEPTVQPSPELEAAWEREETALERGDVDAAVDAVVGTWTLPGAPESLRDHVGAMQRRAYALQGQGSVIAEAVEAPDPLEEHPELISLIDVPALVLVGAHDKQEFLEGAELLARALPNARHEVIEGAGHLAPLETPNAFLGLVLAFLNDELETFDPS